MYICCVFVWIYWRFPSTPPPPHPKQQRVRLCLLQWLLILTVQSAHWITLIRFVSLARMSLLPSKREGKRVCVCLCACVRSEQRYVNSHSVGLWNRSIIRVFYVPKSCRFSSCGCSGGQEILKRCVCACVCVCVRLLLLEHNTADSYFHCQLCSKLPISLLSTSY